MPFAVTWTDLKLIRLGEVNQAEEDRYHRISLICDSLNANELT